VAGDEDEDVFLRRLRTIGPFGVSPAFGYDEAAKLFSGGIEEKLGQLIPGRCNILAFNRDPFTKRADVLRRALARVFDEDQRGEQHYARISAFLVLELEPIEALTSRAFVLSVDLVRNPSARDGAAVPDDLAARLEGPKTLTLTL
jgi:hypothetical protein